jgi:ParB family chromosome partitioning protein
MQLADAKKAKRGRVSSQPIETKKGAKPKRGRPVNKAVQRIMGKKKCSRATAFRQRKRSLEYRRELREKIEAETAKAQFCPVIKPMNNWDFTRILYPRLDPDETYGYLPGDVYANCLFHHAPAGGLVIELMAGSGMIRHVYEDRKLWSKGREQPFDLDLRMFDLVPRGPYAALIKPWNILDGFPPVERAPDYVIFDPPYLGMCKGQYSDKAEDLANMGTAGWTAGMYAIAQACASVEAKCCTVIVPASVDHANWSEVHCPEIVREAFKAAGYRLHRTCYASKHTQQHPGMARWNNIARERRVPIADIAEVQTFVRL